VTNFVLNNQLDALIIQIYSVIKIYMFRASSLSIIRSYLLYIRHWYASCRFDDRFLAESEWKLLTLTGSGHQTCMKPTNAKCTLDNSWWWTEKMPERCRFLWQNKFG